MILGVHRYSTCFAEGLASIPENDQDPEDSDHSDFESVGAEDSSNNSNDDCQ